MAFVEGERIRLIATFTNDDGTKVDPASPVEVTVKAPDGTLLVDGANAQKIDTGEYRYIVDTTISGKYFYKFTTGSDSIEVDSFEMGPDETLT